MAEKKVLPVHVLVISMCHKEEACEPCGERPDGLKRNMHTHTYGSTVMDPDTAGRKSASESNNECVP